MKDATVKFFFHAALVKIEVRSVATPFSFLFRIEIFAIVILAR